LAGYSSLATGPIGNRRAKFDEIRWMMTRTTAVKPENAVVRYIKDTRAELAKVTWPTREEGLRLTTVVLIVTAISAVALFGVDSFFSLLIALLLRVI
jgi:preprotein translocase subunit SecE